MAVQLSYTRRGHGDTLILLHGNDGDRTVFDAHMDAFAAVFDVVAVDTRGHGQSPRGNAPFTLSQFASDLKGFTDALGIGRAHILGFSDGGNIALLFALRYPQKVRSLVLNGANLYPTGMLPRAVLDVWRQYALVLPRSPFSAAARRKREMLGLMAFQPHIRPGALLKLTMPALVLAGTQDLIRDTHTRLIARSLPNGTLCILPGSHFLVTEAPEAYRGAVLDWFGKIGAIQGA